MVAIIRRYAAPAAFSDSLVLDLEPLISYPAGLLAEYRLKASEAKSAMPRQGEWAALVSTDSGADVVYGPASALAAGKHLAIPSRPMPTGSMTMLVVSRQVAGAGAAPYQWLGGGADSANASYGMYRANGTLATAMRIGGSHYATMPAEGGDRFEALFGVVDTAGQKARIYRPRTGTEVVADLPGAPPVVAGAIRVLGHALYAAPVEGALVAFISGALSTAQMDAIYASAKASLASGGVDI
ncbi:TPA: hypothetical protein UM343_000948 [Stenotrophomonas maltophilia]|nr:hypothetical protein [Stenotrophomonas maltophilia]